MNATSSAFESLVMSEMHKVNKAQFATLCYTTSCNFPLKSGLAQVEKCVTITQAQLARDYEQAVNNALKKQGLPTNFVSQPKKGGHWVQGLENKVSECNGTKYLRFYITKATDTKVVYVENGQPCSAARVAQIQAYKATKGARVIGTQAAVGLALDEQIELRDLTISKLHYLTTNGVTLQNTGNALQIAL